MNPKQRAFQLRRVNRPADVEAGEGEFLEVFFDWIHTVYPNKHRKGCPGRSALLALETVKGRFEDEYTLQHIGRCAACLDDLMEIRRGLRRLR
jgi:hypothetical protein